jgi:hypothetical protein
MVLSIVACVMQAWCRLGEEEAVDDLGILLIPSGLQRHCPGTAGV